MSVLLIHPPQVGHIGLQRLTFVEPLALERIAAVVPEARPYILDMRLDSNLEATLKETRPLLVGIACPFTTQVPMVLRLADRVKQAAPKTIVVVGGHHPALVPRDFAVPSVDAIVMGEGEATFREVVERAREGDSLDDVPGLVLNGPDGQRSTPPRQPIADLDSLPLPARQLTARWRRRYFWINQVPHALVETSRGCPYRCTFCSVWRFHGPHVRYQSPERIVDEIAAVQEPHILFTDDNFFLNVPRARQAAELLLRRGLRKRYTFQARTDTIAQHPDLVEQWRKVGLVSVFLGLEAVSAEHLSDLDKRNTVENNEAAIDVLKRLGVGFVGNFIVDPAWGAAEFGELREYVIRHQLFNSSFSVLTPLPGTALHEELHDQICTHDYQMYDLWHAILPTRLPREQFYHEFARLWQAAGASAPTMTRYRRLLRGLWEVLSGRTSLRHARLVAEGLAELRDPKVYLEAHLKPAS